MTEFGGWWSMPASVGVGVLLAIVIDRLTEYFTGTHAQPVNDIKKAADTGPATLILNGVSVGFESSVWSVLVIALTIVASIFIFGTIPDVTATERATFILYGVAMTGIGILPLTGNNVAKDTFGTISDNAKGIGEMAWHGRRFNLLASAWMCRKCLSACWLAAHCRGCSLRSPFRLSPARLP